MAHVAASVFASQQTAQSLTFLLIAPIEESSSRDILYSL